MQCSSCNKLVFPFASLEGGQVYIAWLDIVKDRAFQYRTCRAIVCGDCAAKETTNPVPHCLDCGNLLLPVYDN